MSLETNDLSGEEAESGRNVKRGFLHTQGGSLRNSAPGAAVKTPVVVMANRCGKSAGLGLGQSIQNLNVTLKVSSHI